MDARKENAHGVLDHGRKDTFQETEPSKAHMGHHAASASRIKPLFDAASDYRRARLDLIPLKARDKAPADPRWQSREYEHSQTLERAKRGELNLGVRLPADVVVIDVDPRNFDGNDSLAKLVAAVGLDLSAAPHVVTGNLDHPGHHYYFRKPAGVALLDTIDGYPGVEFKSLGRQVVAAGSIHPTGGRYEWAPDSPPLHDMPDLPAQLVEMARRPPPKKSSGAGEITAEQLAASLEYLDPSDFSEHDTWRELMMACHHATDGEERDEFIDWSTSDPAYSDHGWIVGRRWDSLHADRGDAVTIATLRKYLNEVGADIPASAPEDDFDVWDEVEPVEQHSRWNFLSLEDVESLPPPKWLVMLPLFCGVLSPLLTRPFYAVPRTSVARIAWD